MSNHGRNSAYFDRLMEIAVKAGVQVEFLPSGAFPDLAWDGLYLVTNGWGAGIAIRDGLPTEWRDWILAHELGHHFTPAPMRLFSPFHFDAKPPLSATWRVRARAEPEEVAADRWAATTLISVPAWESAETESPCDLAGIVERLALPPPAAIAWERMQRARHKDQAPVPVRLGHRTWDAIAGPVTGQGGHQSFFRRLLASRDGMTVGLSFVDFSLARERVLTVEGGWRQRYGALLEALKPKIVSAGSARQLFRLEP